MVHVFCLRAAKTQDDADALDRWLTDADPKPAVSAETWGMSAEAERAQRGLMGMGA